MSLSCSRGLCSWPLWAFPQHILKLSPGEPVPSHPTPMLPHRLNLEALALLQVALGLSPGRGLRRAKLTQKFTKNSG